jgi:hypothetical protein
MSQSKSKVQDHGDKDKLLEISRIMVKNINFLKVSMIMLKRTKYLKIFRIMVKNKKKFLRSPESW